MDLAKLKSLKGILYREVKKSTEEKEEPLPGFAIQKPKRLIEFPEIKDIKTVNVSYSLIEPFIYVNIKWDPQEKEVVYNVIEPKMTNEEIEIVKKISDGLIELVEVELTSIKEPSKIIEYLEKNVVKVIKEFGLKLSPNQFVKTMYYIYRNFIGYNEIEAFLQDPNIEDISCDGTATPIYVIHRKFGSLKTNMLFEKGEELREFIIKLAERCGRYVSYAEPILAGTLPDGSRVSATLAGDVATRGPTFTIRKFTEKPISPIEQLKYKTVSAEVLAYFWYLIEHGVSMLMVGGVATGKTSFLNSLCMFVPPEAKIVSIEDTRELKIPNEHWIPGVARVGFGIPTPTGEKYGDVSLFDLLKESFRQNPDYVVVGEVRGKETYVMFQGMSSGHPCLSTFHAGSVDTVIKRLVTPPIDLSPTLIESLDVITIMVHAREKGKSARRVKQVVEIESVDPKTEEVSTRTIFLWNPAEDKFEKVADSLKVEKIVAAIGGKKEDALADIENRAKILQWLEAKGITDYLEVTKYINMYYKERDAVLKMIGEIPRPIEVPMQRVAPMAIPAVSKPIAAVERKIIERKEKGRRKISILELLGYKVLREKS